MTNRFDSYCNGVALIALAATALAAAPATKPVSLAGQSHQFESLTRAGMLLRPRDASSAEGVPIVLYPQQDWKCMTWKLEPIGDGDEVRLVNYFTHKTFYPDPAADDAPVTQHAAAKVAATAERWKLVPTDGGAFRLDHVTTGKTLTVTPDGALVVSPWTGGSTQQWKLLDKPAHFTG